MIRFASLATAFFTFAGPAFAVSFEANEQGQIEFTMPSGNTGCVHTPAGGTNVYGPMDGGPELSCDRVEPSYVRVIMGPKGVPKRFTKIGDASCCGSDNVFDYGETWKMGPFSCSSTAAGLTCARGSHGFSISRKAVKVH